MNKTWLKFAVTMLIALTGATQSAQWALAAEEPDAKSDLASVDKRIAELLPTAKERRIDEIGWAKDIREAERLARKHGRPVFLFSNVGEMGTGRC